MRLLICFFWILLCSSAQSPTAQVHVFFVRSAPYEPPGFLNFGALKDEAHTPLGRIPRKDHLIVDELIQYHSVEDTHFYPAHARTFRGDAVTYGTHRAETVDVYETIYSATFELEPGVYRFKVDKSLNTGPRGYGRIHRHKIFDDVTVAGGRTVILTHYWRKNARFGENLGETRRFRQLLEQQSQRFGDNLLQIVR